VQTTDFVALYRGQTVADARLVAVTAEPEIVEQFVRSLAGEREDPQKAGESKKPRVLQVVEGGDE
jgi:hypothetical protein